MATRIRLSKPTDEHPDVMDAVAVTEIRVATVTIRTSTDGTLYLVHSAIGADSPTLLGTFGTNREAVAYLDRRFGA